MASARSWIWVGIDAPETRLVPREVTLAVQVDPERGGAIIDLFAERGGREFAGLAVHSLAVPGLRRIGDLAGAEVADPPPPLLGIGRAGAQLGACAGGRKAANPLRKLGFALELDQTPPPDEIPPGELEPPEEIDEEAAPDDDAALGDIEAYRRRRAEEARLEPAPEDPELDEEALAEADAAAAAERVLVYPDQAYEIEAIKLSFVALEKGWAEIALEGRCAEVDEEGEVERAGVPFGGRLRARVEEH